MSRRRKVMVVYGTRPEAIKLAPVIHRFQARPDAFDLVQCHTGQHAQMLQQVCDYFGLRADVCLEVMRPNQSLAGLTSRLFEALDATLEKCRPDLMVVQGDTTSAMAASVAAFYRRLPVLHVEAGLRTGDMAAPWPEEFNRRVVSLVTAIHCAPTERAAEQLRREGCPPRTIHVTGNTVVDALLWTVDRERQRPGVWRERYPMVGLGPLVLITAHRRESFGRGLAHICRAIARLSREFPDAQFIYPVHLNPNVREPVHSALGDRRNIHLVEPAPYPAFVWLMDQATLILSDSGGVQEEAPSLRKPVLVMRDTTERQEAVDAGAVKLVGTDADRIFDESRLLLADARAYAAMQVDRNPYGDGKAAQRIAALAAHDSHLHAAAQQV
jgi:UDP-N-acetylglucosamine 2-epimerase (non-hydrolysing)